MNLPPPRPPDGFHEPSIDRARLDANWRAISVELDAPRPSWIERGLRRLGLPATVTRPALATPSLRRAWYAAIALVVIIGLVAADPDDPRASAFVLLFLAPIVPLLGVSLAFGPDADPAHEAHLATPTQGVRLVLLRATTVLAISFVVIGGLALLTDVTRPLAAAWMLPSIGLTAASTAVMTTTSPRRAVGLVGVAWVIVALIGRGAADDRLGAFGPAAQLAFFAVAVVGVVVTYVRREQLDVLRGIDR